MLLSSGLKGDSTLRDLVAYPIEILGGSQYEMHTGGAPEESTFIMTGMRNIFRLRFEVRWSFPEFYLTDTHPLPCWYYKWQAP